MELGERRERGIRRDRKGKERTARAARTTVEVTGTTAVEVGNRREDGRPKEVRANVVWEKVRTEAEAAHSTSTATIGAITLEVGAHGTVAPFHAYGGN